LLYKRKRLRFKKIKKFLFLTIILIILTAVVFEMQAIPFTKKCVNKQAKSISSRIIADTVNEVINKFDYSYKDLSVINYSDKGEVNSISSNTVKVNRIKSNIINKIQDELDKENIYKFSLPLGSFTDITILSTLGPDIEISFVLTGSVNCKIKNSFESTGVNQTLHHIYLVINTEIITLSPEYTEKIRFSTDYEIAQTVIVGSIPSTYADIVR
jgi:sporulation protein YunB